MMWIYLVQMEDIRLIGVLRISIVDKTRCLALKRVQENDGEAT